MQGGGSRRWTWVEVTASDAFEAANLYGLTVACVVLADFLHKSDRYV
jgi:hypothetical protein